MLTVNEADLKILSLKEDPDKFEDIIVQQQNLCDHDAQLKILLESIFLEKNRDLAFDRFIKTNEFKTILKLLSYWNISAKHRLAEIGGGPGFLSWALYQSGYPHIELIEPNPHYNTGTGYIRSRQDSQQIVLHNQLNQWHSHADPYDVIITKNCIHHFQNIAQSAAIIRQKMRPEGLWFAFREWFADTPEELYSQLKNHPYCQPFNIYEWPYPASHYAEAIEIAGFKLLAVIPYDYANNCLGTWSEEIPSEQNQKFTHAIDELLQTNPAQTVEYFWNEVYQQKCPDLITHSNQSSVIQRIKKFINSKSSSIPATKSYTRPQMMLFKKIDINGVPT